MTLAKEQRRLTTRKRWSVFPYPRRESIPGIRNKQMLSSAKKMCIIKLLGYSVEEAYCRLEFDFARVGSSRSDRKELATDEKFDIRRGSFSYGKEEPTDMNGTGIVQLIKMFSFPVTLSHNCSDSNRFTKVVENQTRPDFLLDIVCFFRVEMSQSYGILQFPERCFNSPSHMVQFFYVFWRELLWGKICDNAFVRTVSNWKPNDSQIHLIEPVMM